MIAFETLIEFRKDLKNLVKHYRSLEMDLAVVKKILTFKPDAQNPFSFRIDNLGIKTCVIKVKKIACKTLKGKGVNSGLRLVYAYFPEENRIVFIELYHKNNQEHEDRKRIMQNFG